MDLAATINSIAAKGAMFWAATGSVALGGTLILVAVVAQLRGLTRKRGNTAVLPAASEPAVDVQQLPEMENLDLPVDAGTADPAEGPAREQTDDRELRQMLVRLRAAADKLEEFNRRSAEKTVPAGESPLKETVSPVDYVFRAGLG